MPLHHSPKPMTYSGSAKRAMHLRRSLRQRWQRGWSPPVGIVLILFWWLAVTVCDPLWLLPQLLASAVRRDAWKDREERGYRRFHQAYERSPRPRQSSTADPEDVGVGVALGAVHRIRHNDECLPRAGECLHSPAPCGRRILSGSVSAGNR